jgi:uncharacterized protein YgbK (DUF1537 family)
MNETTDDQIRAALEQAEHKALEAGEIFTDRQAHALVARMVARAERRCRRKQALPVDDLLAGLDDAEACSE